MTLNGWNDKTWKYIVKIWRNQNFPTLLVGISNGTTTWENWLVIFILKPNIYLPYDSVNLLLIIYPRGIKSQVYEMDMIMFTMVLFTIAPNWKPLKCLSIILMDKQIMVFSPTVIWLGNKKRTNCRCLQQDGSHRFDVERKKSVQKSTSCEILFL